MTGLDVNLLGVLLCGVASMAIGAVYYSDAVLGKQWKKLGKIDVKRYQKETPKMIPVILVGALFTAYLVGVIECFYEKFYVANWTESGLVAALIVWAAVATSMIVHGVLDQRPQKLLAITIGNRFVTLLAMGLILGVFNP
jgi:hypothetical protein